MLWRLKKGTKQLLISSAVLPKRNSFRFSVIDKSTKEKLPYIHIFIENTGIGTVSNQNGEFEIKNVRLGYLKVSASFVGFSTVISDDYLVTKEKSHIESLKKVI